ncbi:MAG: DUF2961 domain-containing protein [Sedimentisphaerales bacterium]|nr:DUF2961 domain-containing protein [Sedimentisphaerales bacterium]
MFRFVLRFLTDCARQPIAQGNWGIGHTTNVRVRIHDRIPFLSKFQFDMELFHWQPKRKIDYATTTHWYAFDGATSNGQVTAETGMLLAPGMRPRSSLWRQELPHNGLCIGVVLPASQRISSADKARL